MNNRKAILFSAPSGSGKTTIIREILKRFDCFEFSISATSRQAREGEQDGVDYYFLTPDEFEKRVNEGLFLEWEEVYAGIRYGTLKSEIDRIWSNGHVIIFDVDVNGGMNIKAEDGRQVRCDHPERRFGPRSGRDAARDKQLPQQMIIKK